MTAYLSLGSNTGLLDSLALALDSIQRLADCVALLLLLQG